MYASLRVPSLNTFYTKDSSTAQWNHTLPSLSVPLSTVVRIEIYERRGRWRRNRRLAGAHITVEDMLEAMDQHKCISLPLKPDKHTVISPSLRLSVHVDRMDIAFVSAQLANLQSTKSLNSYETFQQVVRRLERLARLSSTIAQINPISTAVYSIAGGILQIFMGHMAANEKLSALIHQIHAILELVDSALLLEKYPVMVEEILQCIMRCILFISKREHANPAHILISDDNSYIEKLQQELRDLESEISRSTYYGIAQRTFEIVNEMGDTTHDRLLINLNPLRMPHTTTCLPGTRSSVISELTQWALLSSSKILWMHAHAGSGKSTISTTMANLFESLGCLGSFVFFNRDVEERSEPSRMIATIAYQLARHRKDIADAILRCMSEHPLTLAMAPELGFQRLLVEPLAKVENRERLVIIIDALDEGGDSPLQEAFLSLLSSGLGRLPDFVRVMITSRRYPSIERALGNVADLRVLDLNLATGIDDDIRSYISVQIDGIPPPPGWSEKNVLESLVKQAGGLFIWAAVACSYIKKFNSTSRMQQLLANASVRARALDDLYHTAVLEAGPWSDDDFSKYMHDMLAIVVISQNPQSIHSITDILQIDNDLTEDLISRLHSIIEIDETRRVRVIHPSVRDYLVDPARCGAELPWFIGEEVEHKLMATRCIQHLDGRLARNTGSPLPDAVAYASVSWVHHVGRINLPSAQLTCEVHTFLVLHFLHWLEALSILGESRNAIGWLDQMQEWNSKLQLSLTLNPPLDVILYDGWRFVKDFSKTIETHPSYIYETALPFCPQNTAISALFSGEKKFSVVSGCLQHWSPSLMTLTGFILQVQSLSFSKSGDKMAAGCFDGTLKVWNTSLGIEIFSTPNSAGRKSTHGVISTQLSSDGSRLLYALIQGDLSVLEVDTGLILTTLKVRDGEGYGNKGKMSCAAVAADDCTVVCGFRDGMVQIWNTESQLALTPLLAGHQGLVESVAFSHNQQMVVSGSVDNTVRLWYRTGTQQRTFLGHTRPVTCVSFSPDDTKIGSTSMDRTMRVWDTLTGSMLLNCAHADGAVFTLAFSHNGERIATGTQRSEIRIWDSERGKEVMVPFTLHRGPIVALAFAPDDKTIVSSSSDLYVRIWSLTSMALSWQTSVQPSHKDYVSCISLTQDRTRFVTGSQDNSLIVWNTSDGSAVLPPLDAHHAEIVAVDFSGDDTLFASGSKDGVVHLWDTLTWQLHGAPLGHTHSIVGLKISADCSKLATITKDSSLTLWDLPERRILLGPVPYANRTFKAVAFSHNGSRLAIFFHHLRGESTLGLGIMITDASDGHIMFEIQVDGEIEGNELYEEKLEYTSDDRYLVVWYSLSFTSKEIVAIRAFDTATGKEYDYNCGRHEIPQLNNLVAANKQIMKNGDKIAELPLDLDWMGSIQSWTSTENMIIVGTLWGYSYVITLVTPGN
ncbi:WD40-repeat-containing domain protein [Mycena galericulata]|nr:WD40-repeat-containing domain protein [Mycena galericulata]